MTFRGSVRDTVDEDLAETYTMQLGRVRAVNADGTLEVQPLNRLQVTLQDNEGRFDYGDPPTLPARPPTTLSCAGGEIRFKVSVGDLVRLDHHMHSLDEHLQSDVSAPVTAAWMVRHDINDCTATPVRVRGATFAPVGDIDIDCDDLRLGRPADALALVTSAFQATLDAWWLKVVAALDTAIPGGVTFTVAAGTELTPEVLVAPSLDLTEHVKAS